MFVNDNIVIYITVKKDKSATKSPCDATKRIRGGSLSGDTLDFRFPILNIFFINWGGNFFAARFVFWIFRIMGFSLVEVPQYIYIYIYIYMYIVVNEYKNTDIEITAFWGYFFTKVIIFFN